jgi:hypothetical protein
MRVIGDRTSPPWTYYSNMDKMKDLVGQQPIKKIGESRKNPTKKKWRRRDFYLGPSYFAVYHTLFKKGGRKATDSSQ